MAENWGYPHFAFSTFGTTLRQRIITLLKKLVFNKDGSVSRPKLLLMVAATDLALMTAAWPMAKTLSGASFAMSWSSFTATTCVGLVTVGILRLQWSYSVPALRRLPSQLLKVITSIVIVAIVMAGLSFLFDQKVVAPREILYWTGLSSACLCVVRAIAATAIDRLTGSGRLLRRTVIVGGGKDAEELIREVIAAKHLRILGIFDDRQDERATGNYEGVPLLGNFQILSDFCRVSNVDLLIVTVPQRAEERLLQILDKLFTLQVDVRISALSSKLRFKASSYSFIGRVPMLSIMDKPLNDWDRVLKNVEDRVLGSVILLAALPVMALIALAIRLDSSGPIFFRQKRYGFNNELIEVAKFRSLYVSGQDLTGSEAVVRNDSRVTPVGRLIRRTSLDELPQLINVVKGEMSLVGPRPHATGSRAGQDLFEHVAQRYFARHKMKPGVTGWAQINGWRGGADTPEKLIRRVEHDLYYIDNWSILFDLYILAMTPLSLFTGENAY